MDTQATKVAISAKKGAYETIPSYALAALLVLLPVFFIPLLHVSFVFAKMGLLFLVTAAALVCLILNVLNERKVGIPSGLYLGVVAALPIAYLASSIFSKDQTGSLIGQGTETDTLFFVTVATVLMVMVARFFGDKRRLLTSVLGLLLISLLVSGFHVLRYIFGASFLSLGTFTTITSNTVGSFSDLGIFAGLAVILSILTLEFLFLSRNVRIGLGISLGLSLIVACVSNFYLVTDLFGLGIPLTLSSVLALFSLVILIHKKVSSPKRSFPHVTLVVFLITLAFTVQTQNIASMIGGAIGISQNDALDIRVSPSGTGYVAGKVMAEGTQSALVGAGPNRFFAAWAAHKPIALSDSVNTTSFWNTDFNLGFGYIPTSVVTSGIIGGLAWLAFLLLLAYSIYRLFRQMLKTDRDPLTIYSALVASIGSAYLWLFAVAYTPGPVVLPLAFFFTGILGSILISEKIIAVRFVSWEKAGYWKSFAAVFALVLSIALLVGIGYIWSNKLIGSIYADKALSVLQESSPDIATAEALVSQAISHDSSSAYLRLYSDVVLARPLQLITKDAGSVPPADITQGIAADMYRSIGAAEYAAFGKKTSYDYHDWIQLGKTYEAATFLGATSTAQRAAQSYAQAEMLAPTNPLPSFMLGRLFVYARQKDLALSELKKALALKPDYGDALKLLQALNAAEPAVTPEASLSSTASSTAATSTKRTAVRAKTAATTTKARK